MQNIFKINKYAAGGSECPLHPPLNTIQYILQFKENTFFDSEQNKKDIVFFSVRIHDGYR